MSTVQEEVRQLLERTLGARACQSVMATLPACVQQAPGTLDAVSVRELLERLVSGQRLFAQPGQAFPVSALRGMLTRGKSPLPTVETLAVSSDADVLQVQRRCQFLGRGFFSPTDCIRLATAASELARNIYMYAGRGTLTLTLAEEAAHHRFELLAVDQGPGIPHLDVVLSGRYVSRTGLGKGLYGVRNLLDAFTVDSTPGKGTRVHGVRRARRT